MRKLILSTITILVIGLPSVAFSQNCDALRRACQMRAELGEQGQGNCRRYHEACDRSQDICAELRKACMYKDALGEQGQGNCRRYRETCTQR
jgi:hypothetical protein